MKRLVKKANRVFLYHGTSIDSLRSILSSGMIYPQEVEILDWNNREPTKEYLDKYFDGDIKLYEWHRSNYDGFVFFATDIETAKWYGKKAAFETDFPHAYAILVFDLFEDALLPDLNDCPDCKTWQESAEKVNQVSVSGTITTDYLREIIIVYGDIEIETTPDRWEEDVKQAIIRRVRTGEISVLDFADMIRDFGIEFEYR